MKLGQKYIYYITVSSNHHLEKSPFFEQIKTKTTRLSSSWTNYEVIFFMDLADKYFMKYLMDCEDKNFHNVSKKGLILGTIQRLGKLNIYSKI